LGALALGWHAIRVLVWRGERKRLWIATAACAGVLVANFPAAGAVLFAVTYLESRYEVVVHNAGDAPLADVRVFGGGVDERMGRFRRVKRPRARSTSIATADWSSPAGWTSARFRSSSKAMSPTASAGEPTSPSTDREKRRSFTLHDSSRRRLVPTATIERGCILPRVS
jgi:hypothetical protein